MGKKIHLQHTLSVLTSISLQTEKSDENSKTIIGLLLSLFEKWITEET
jgi:hypothetical protein